MMLKVIVVSFIASAAATVPYRPAERERFPEQLLKETLELNQQPDKQMMRPKNNNEILRMSVASEYNNIARLCSATQVSTDVDDCNPVAAKATDGNTEGDFQMCSVSFTQATRYPWWEVNLGYASDVASVIIFNRDDCCMDLLSRFWVTLYTTTRHIQKTLTETSGGTEVMSYYMDPLLTNIQWVLVQRMDGGTIALAEVQVFGRNDGVAEVINFAVNQTATQSSTPRGSTCGPPTADKAVDDNTEGDWSFCSIASTQTSDQPWWEVDLGQMRSIETINIFNRVDCCMRRLVNFNVILYNDLGTVVKNVHFAGGEAQEVYTTTFPIIRAERVRVRLQDRGKLTLAEVQAFGPDMRSLLQVARKNLVNLARGRPAKQSSDAEAAGENACDFAARKAVDGSTTGDCSLALTGENANRSWWEVDLGEAGKIRYMFLFNRVDCCKERLTNFEILLYDHMHRAVKTIQELQDGSGGEEMFAYEVESYVRARYVRVQLMGRGSLGLAEVEVYG